MSNNTKETDAMKGVAIKAIQRFNAAALKNESLISSTHDLLSSVGMGAAWDGPIYASDLLLEVLTIFMNPQVSSMLPKHMQESAGGNLAALYRFFSNMKDNDSIAAELDMYAVEHLKLDGPQLANVIANYSKMAVRAECDKT